MTPPSPAAGLIAAIDDALAALADLQDVRTGQTRTGAITARPAHGRRNHTRPTVPIRPDAIAATAHLATSITDAAHGIATANQLTLHPTLTPPEARRWAARHKHAINTQPWPAAHHTRRIEQATAHATRITDQPPNRLWTIDCPGGTHPHTTTVDLDDRLTTCTECGHLHDIARVRRQLWAQARNQLLTREELIVALADYESSDPNRRRIRNWLHRQRLTPAAHISPDGETHLTKTAPDYTPLYRLGTALDLIDPTRKNQP